MRPSLGYSNYYWIRQDQKRLEKKKKEEPKTEEPTEEKPIEETIPVENPISEEMETPEENEIEPISTSLLVLPTAITQIKREN